MRLKISADLFNLMAFRLAIRRLQLNRDRQNGFLPGQNDASRVLLTGNNT